MFSGIIQELGLVRRTDVSRTQARLILEVSSALAKRLKIGSSLAVNGVCLSVIAKKGSLLSFDIISETLQRTNLGLLKAGHRVNVEPSLRWGDPIDGHPVMGHVDGIGKIVRRIEKEGQTTLIITFSVSSRCCIVEKGSIAVDGVSLTVGRVRSNQFEVYLIPHTLVHTTLGVKKKHEVVNIEVDR